MKKRILSVFFALVLVVSLGLVTAVPAAAAGVDWYVDASVVSSGDGTSSATAFKTIGEGVTAADPAGGDTVNVAAGTYNEHVVIDKQLTLLGANHDVNPVTHLGERGDESIIDGTGLAPVPPTTPGGLVSVTGAAADGTVFNGFTVIESPYKSGGIDVWQVDNSVYENNIVSDNENTAFYIVGDGNVIRNNVISNNRHWGEIGQIILSTEVDDNIIENNAISGGGWIQIFLWNAKHGNIVQNNTITGVGLDEYYENPTGQTADAFGILLSAIGNDNIVRGNTIAPEEGGLGFTRAINIAGDRYGGSNTLVEDNTIHGNVVGVKIGTKIKMTLVKGNDIQENEYGIRIERTAENTIIEQNDLLSNEVGIIIAVGSDPTAASTTHIKLNNIVGNTTGVLNEIETTIDATSNWWGSAVESEIQALIIGVIGGTVLYDPWYADEGMTELASSKPVINTTQKTSHDTIQLAIDVADPDDTIDVAAGTYNERLTVNKSLDLRGAQYGEDPTQLGARITPADESIIDITSLSPINPNVAVEIASGVSNVSVAGFTLIGSPSQSNGWPDESVIRCWEDDIVIEDNIINGYYGVLHRGTGNNLGVHRNRMVVNKNGVVSQNGEGKSNATISDNLITLGSSPAGDESAIKISGWRESSSVTGNTITGFIHNAALGGSNLSNLTVSGNTFTGNAAGISIWGNSTFITIRDNELSDSVVWGDWGADSGCGIVIKAQDVVITGNQITNNANFGVKIDQHANDTVRNTISHNNIVGNANYGVWVNTTLVTETIDATNNWWDNASGPTHATTNPFGIGDAVSDNVTYNPWQLAKVNIEEVAEGILPTTYDKTLALKDGWTLISVDKAVAAEAIWVGTNPLVVELAYKYTPTSGFVSEVTTADLEPLTAIYVLTKGGGGVGIKYAEVGDPPLPYSKELEAGWNLIGVPSMGEGTETDDILSPLRYVTAGTQQVIGLTTLVSQEDYNQFGVGFYDATLTETDWTKLKVLNPFDGYWAYMEAADTFEVIPQ